MEREGEVIAVQGENLVVRFAVPPIVKNVMVVWAVPHSDSCWYMGRRR